jgi:hypothetical protein
MIRMLIALVVCLSFVEFAAAAERPIRTCVGGACKKIVQARPVKRIFGRRYR